MSGGPAERRRQMPTENIGLIDAYVQAIGLAETGSLIVKGP
jgi:hypothetical protein